MHRLFVFGISVSIVTISVFTPPPHTSSFLPLFSKAPIPLSRLQQPSHSAKITSDFCFFFSRMAFLSYCCLSFFYYNTNYYYYYYCKVYLEETFVYYTITILSVTAGRKRNVENQQLNYLLFQTQHIQTLSFDSSLFFWHSFLQTHTHAHAVKDLSHVMYSDLKASWFALCAVESVCSEALCTQG